ncbi:MAG: ABC transporter ATP-binding protein [Hungatella hathewayi]|nr:ABC transporter ATP-binding protein [Hungatella hathewayi]
MAQYMIETNQLTKTYHGTTAVEHLALRIPKGAIYGFLGPNGAGKSTTMKMLLGLINRDGGSIRINGTELNDSSRISILKQVGSLIENPSYYGNLTAYENLQISCMLRGLPYTEIDRVLSIVRLDGQKKKRTAHYSLGMKQRLGLANALLGSPAMVLLDEPTNGLDPAGIHEMRELIKSLPKNFGMTVMVSSHLLAEMEQTADYIGIISTGQLIFQDALSKLQARSTSQICLRTSDDTGAASLLQENEELSALFCESKVTITPDDIRLPFLSDQILARIIRSLLDHGIELYRAEEKRQNLEDIYLGMVKEAGL